MGLDSIQKIGRFMSFDPVQARLLDRDPEVMDNRHTVRLGR